MDFNQQFTEASAMLKVTSVVIVLALLMHCVGFLTIAWTVTTTSVFTFRMGLWTSCMDLFRTNEPVCGKTEGDPSNGWIQVVQVLESIGLATFVLSLVGALIQLFVKRNLVICYANIAAILCTGVTIEAGCVYFLIKVLFDDIGYSVSLSAAAGLLALISTVLLILDSVKLYRYPPITENKRTDSRTFTYSEVLVQEA